MPRPSRLRSPTSAPNQYGVSVVRAEPQPVEHERAALDDVDLDDDLAARAALAHRERDVAEVAEREHLEARVAQARVARVQDVAGRDRQRAPDDLGLRRGVAGDLDRLDQDDRAELVVLVAAAARGAAGAGSARRRRALGARAARRRAARATSATNTRISRERSAPLARPAATLRAVRLAASFCVALARGAATTCATSDGAWHGPRVGDAPGPDGRRRRRRDARARRSIAIDTPRPARRSSRRRPRRPTPPFASLPGAEADALVDMTFAGAPLRVYLAFVADPRRRRRRARADRALRRPPHRGAPPARRRGAALRASSRCTRGSDAVTCPHCSAPLRDDARFCGACGKATSPTEPAIRARRSRPCAELVGREIAGRYRILAKLGEGGMGAVYRGEQISLQARGRGEAAAARAVARTRCCCAGSTPRPRRSRKLSHPNTVNIYDFGQDTDGSLFIAMEFIEGRSLREVDRDARRRCRRARALAHRRAGRGVARRRARARDRPPRSQARQRDAPGARPQTRRRARARLRHREAARRRSRDAAGDDAGRRHARHAAVHGARADPRRGRSTAAPTSTRSAA